MSQLQTDMLSTAGQRPNAPVTGGPSDDTTVSGWVYFAAAVLMLAGVFRIFDAIWAFHYHRALPDGLQGALYGTSLSTYGWIYLGVAGVLILAGLGLFARSQLSRWVGVVAAAIGGVSAMQWMAYYPVWTLIYVGTAVVVIYALVVHGGRTAEA